MSAKPKRKASQLLCRIPLELPCFQNLFEPYKPKLSSFLPQEQKALNPTSRSHGASNSALNYAKTRQPKVLLDLRQLVGHQDPTNVHSRFRVGVCCKGSQVAFIWEFLKTSTTPFLHREPLQFPCTLEHFSMTCPYMYIVLLLRSQRSPPLGPPTRMISRAGGGA